MREQILEALLGGALIGLAATILLLFNGRVAGVSGILSGALKTPDRESFPRYGFLAGLLAGGWVLLLSRPEVFGVPPGRGFAWIAIAGVLVGVGTAMSGGCTSGHGVCGISRLSFRSIVATAVFIVFGMLTVFTTGLIGGAP